MINFFGFFCCQFNFDIGVTFILYIFYLVTHITEHSKIITQRQRYFIKKAGCIRSIRVDISFDIAFSKPLPDGLQVVSVR